MGTADGRDIGDAADWLIRMLGTRQANGRFTAVIWGLSVDTEGLLGKHSRLMPFDRLPHSPLKQRICDRARKLGDAVWVSERYFELPGAVIVRKVDNFPYIRADDASFVMMKKLEEEIYEILIFLQGKAIGRPLVLASWFEYDDKDLDLNGYENYFSWMLPEIAPSIPKNAAVVAANVRQ